VGNGVLNLDQKFYFVSLSGDKCVGSFRDVVRLTFSWRTLRIAVAFMWLFAIVDLHLKESARAKLRVLVRRILKKYGYPPDLAPVAINTVLSQAETLLKWGA
jgi:hypothetical protein